MRSDKIETVFEWAIWALIMAFLLWALTAVINACVMLVGGTMAWWLVFLVVPAGIADIWLLEGCISLALKSTS